MDIFKPIKTLNKRTFKQKKGRNFVAVIAIILTTMLFTTLFVLSQSMTENFREMTFRQAGYDAQASFKSTSKEVADKLEAHHQVKEVGRSIVLGTAENKELAGRSTEIRWANDSYASHSYAFPSVGTMPKEKDEIALDTMVLDRLGIPHNLGERVTLTWRKDMNSQETTESTFTLCGYWEENQSSYASQAWVSEEFAQEAIENAPVTQEDDPSQILGTYMVQVNLNTDENIEETMEEILGDIGCTGEEYSINLAYDSSMDTQAFMENLPMYAGMLLVFLAGYLIIYNIFQIGVAADIQFYGKLKTLGTTKKQIKKLIYGQAWRLCIIGVPIGLVIGYLLGRVLVPVLVSFQDGEILVSADPVIFIGSAVFAVLTVYISCMRPAKMAGKVSPMEALRYTDAKSDGKKKTKKSKNRAVLYSMAWANLGRNKKRTAMVICSLTLGLVLLSCFYAKNASFDVEKYLMDLTVADFQIDDSTNASSEGFDPRNGTISQELLGEIEALNPRETGRLYYDTGEIALSDTCIANMQNFYTEERLADYASYDPTFESWKEGYDAALTSKKAQARLYGADGLILDAAGSEGYILDGEYDPEKFAAGNYVLAIGPAADPGTGMPTFSVGETILVNGQELTVMGVVSPLQPMVSGNETSSFSMDLILHADVFVSMYPEDCMRKYYFNVADEQTEEAQEILKGYQQEVDAGMSITSRQTMIDQYEAETRSNGVMGNTISLVIALVGVLNFINSMVTAIVSRKKEFAMIQSVGMTKPQLRKMLITEGLSYAVLTLLASYLLSAFGVGVVVRAMVSGGFSTFRFTLLPLVICTPILLFFAVLIPYLCFRNLEKQSIVERLRME
mgnify:FL=1